MIRTTTRYVRLYANLIRVYLKAALAYRIIIALWAISGIVQTFVALAIWRAVESAGGAPPAFTGDRVVAYFLAVLLVDELTHGWTYWMWEWYARTGRFSGKLSQPVHPLNADVADNLAVKLVSMSVKIPVALVSFAALGVPLPSPDGALGVLGAVAAIMGAYVLRTMLEACLSCLAFELTRMGAVATTWQVSWLFLAGVFAPTRLLPSPVAEIAHVLPLRWALEFPCRVLIGEIGGMQVVTGLAVQAAWITGSFVLFRVMWKRGLGRFAAAGG